MKVIECTCKNCGSLFNKPFNEYNRCIKRDRPIYCSRKCSGQANIKNFKDKRNVVPPVKRNKANPFKYYLKNCIKRNHECNIDIEYLEELWNKQNGRCAYTSIKLILNTHSYRYPDYRYTASLDRIDSKLGYVVGNVQFVSCSINLMKHSLSDQQTKDFLQEIMRNLS